MSKKRNNQPSNVDWERINGKVEVPAGQLVPGRVITWDEFVLKARAIGRHIRGLTDEAVDRAIARSTDLLYRKGQYHRMTQNFMMSRLEAMARGKFDWTTGQTTHFTSDLLKDAEQKAKVEVEE